MASSLLRCAAISAKLNFFPFHSLPSTMLSPYTFLSTVGSNTRSGSWRSARAAMSGRDGTGDETVGADASLEICAPRRRIRTLRERGAACDRTEVSIAYWRESPGQTRRVSANGGSRRLGRREDARSRSSCRELGPRS